MTRAQSFAVSWRPAGNCLSLFALLAGLLAWSNTAAAVDSEQAVHLGRKFLATKDETKRADLAAKLENYAGQIEPVLKQLAFKAFETVESGYLPEENFSVRRLRKKHPDDLLYFNVPTSYRPAESTGLIVFMHGGGNTSSRSAPRYILDFPEEGDEDATELGDIFAASGMIAVGPSAPWNEDSYYRWCLEESDEYLADVIDECKARFNIDPDRVFLMGHSMGGFGAYHHIQRQPDRFAGVLVNSGSWGMAYLPVLRGTPLWIVHGVRDARDGERWHHTDVEHARWTDKLLTQHGIDHTYCEHAGEHSVCFGKPDIAKFLTAAKKLRRDPYSPHVVLASPVGFGRSYSFLVTHNRWLSLDESTEGTLEYDELRENDTEDFDDWRLTHKVSQRRGAAIEAKNRGDNTIEVTTQNVAKFSVWLHPQMIDVAKPVKVIVNGEKKFDEIVQPSLVTAMKSYERRKDWGLVYPIKIELEIDAEE